MGGNLGFCVNGVEGLRVSSGKFKVSGRGRVGFGTKERASASQSSKGIRLDCPTWEQLAMKLLPRRGLIC